MQDMKKEPKESGETPIRRYTHSVEGSPSSPESAALHYISSALSYQNQLLAELLSVSSEILEKLPGEHP